MLLTRTQADDTQRASSSFQRGNETNENSGMIYNKLPCVQTGNLTNTMTGRTDCSGLKLHATSHLFSFVLSPPTGRSGLALEALVYT